MGSIHIAKGKITVKARGYWFTSGGEKGAFGYYPHLKDARGCPIYPDTQLKGNLMMALRWLKELKNLKLNTEDITSFVLVSDLRLSDPSSWSKKNFQIKPRIEIDDKKLTVKTHMLAFLEMAYLEGLELQADIYIGYVKEKEKLQWLKNFIQEAAPLLGSSGAFRSRGAGRGRFKVEWENDMEFVPGESDDLEETVLYTIKALTNFRNKPIETGSYQNISTYYYIMPHQLRAWLLKTYHMLYDEWPTFEQISGIEFHTLYPSLEYNGQVYPGFPPPVTTLCAEDGTVSDVMGVQSLLDETSSAMVKAKRKALPGDTFVTDENNCRLIQLCTEKRIRNALEDTFASLQEGGLFVQEFVLQGQTFANFVRFNLNADKRFLKRVRYILSTVYPLIKGSLFQPKITTANRESSTSVTAYLVTEPIPYNPSLFKTGKWKAEDTENGKKRAYRENANLVKLTTLRSYNTTLNRPRRPRIVIQPGSVVLEPIGEKTIAWKGFGKMIQDRRKKPEDSATPQAEKVKPRVEPEVEELARQLLDEKKFSKSQMGFITHFLNKNIKIKILRKWAEERLEKYTRKKEEPFIRLYTEILKRIDEGDKLRRFVTEFLDQLRLRRWEEKSKKGGENEGDRL